MVLICLVAEEFLNKYCIYQSTLSVCNKIKKKFYEVYGIDKLGSQKFASVVEFIKIRTYSRKMNKLRNVYTIGREAMNISIKKLIFTRTLKCYKLNIFLLSDIIITPEGDNHTNVRQIPCGLRKCVSWHYCAKRNSIFAKRFCNVSPRMSLKNCIKSGIIHGLILLDIY